MKCVLFFALLACLSGHLNVNGMTNPFASLYNWIVGSGSQESVSNRNIALTLVVEQDKRCYLANDEIILNRLDPIYNEFLFVCPAESEEEVNWMASSKTKKALFIKRIEVNPHYTNLSEFMRYNCKNPVMPSVISIGRDLNDPSVELYLVGYEVFLGDDSMLYYEVDSYESANLPDKRFAWFNVYTIAFNKHKHTVERVFSHSLAYTRRSEVMRQPQEADEDYSLGSDEFYEDVDVKLSFSYNVKEYQKLVLEELLKGISVPFSYVDPVQKRFFWAIHLAPLNTFDLPTLRQAGKTYGNIAPMWNMIYKDVWSNVERHLELLSEGVNAINVITGVYGSLKLFDRKIYLRHDGIIEVPAAFFKIISYSPNNDEKYNMVIVTSNNPYDEEDRVNDLICKQNQCGRFGWENIQQDFFAMGRTTCCELTKEVLVELKMKSYESLVDKTLDLNRVPHWINNRVTLNVKKYIMNQILGEELYEPADGNLYRNDKNLEVSDEDGGVTYSRFILTLYKNYVQPYFATNGMEIEVVVQSPSG